MSNPPNRILRKDLRLAFAADHFELHAHIIRLCVLFEDLRTEVRGYSAGRIAELEESGKTIRQQYFIRRSFATLYEFAECVRRLSESSEFSTLHAALLRRPDLLAIWKQSITYFDKHEAMITKIRHDSGGHFGEQAARDVIKQLRTEPDEAIGKIEIFQDPQDSTRAGARMLFTTIITDFAMARHRGTKTRVEFIRELAKIAHEAYRHAADTVNVISGLYVIPRFESDATNRIED